ncbi:MAG TPA: peptidylprolyl isomerase [Bryobacteraceae bacterium]|nr:peptidylprolyl isomerase [Bryobacteraceae bacterium]
MNSSRVFFVLALSVACLWSQSSTPAAPVQSPGTPKPSQPGQASPNPTPGLTARGPYAVAQQDPTRVVATIGGTPITAAQAAELIKPVRQEDLKKFAGHYDKLLQELYMQKQFAKMADEAHMDQQSPWKEQLEVARQNILTQAYISMISNQPGTAPDAKGYYDSHPQEFETIQVSGILIRFAPPGSPAPVGSTDPSKSRTEQQALAKASDLEAKLKGGADFAALAKSDSDNTASGARGGELGSFSLADNTLPADIKSAITTLQPGQVSEPIKQGAGFYILKVTGHTKKSFEEAQPAIIGKFQNDRNTAALNKEFEKYSITVKDPEFFNDGTTVPHNIPSLANPGQPASPSASGPPKK